MKIAERVNDILQKYSNERPSLIPILHDINNEFCYIPMESLKPVSKYLNLPVGEVYRVSTFYKIFSTKPKGKKQIRVCMGTACHVRGSQNILSEFERALNIRCGETTRDQKYSLETVNCVGACARAPIVVVNNEYYSDVKSNRVKKLIENK